jgi:hypothetical protein
MRLTGATNGGLGATNTGTIEVEVRTDASEAGEARPGEASGVAVARTANRRTKEAFNAYQREYMRRRRLREKEAG